MTEVNPNDFISNNRQIELVEMADRGFTALAVRQAIREVVAAARETAQREAEARLLELRRQCKEVCDEGASKNEGDACAVLMTASDIIADLPLPGAKPWEKLLKAAKVRAASGHQDTCGAVLVEVEDRSIECDCGYSELERALASFGEREGK